MVDMANWEMDEEFVRKMTAAFNRLSDGIKEVRLGQDGGNEVEPFDQWATRQIEKLAARAHEIEARARISTKQTDDAITEIAVSVDSVSEELAGTDRAVSAHNDRLRLVETRLEAIEEDERDAALGRGLREIANRVNAFASTLDETGARVRRLESQTEFETSEDDSRIKALEDKVDWVQKVGGSYQAEVERRIGGLETMMADVLLRLQDYGIPHHNSKVLDVQETPKTPGLKLTGRKYQPDLDDELDGIPDVHGRTPKAGDVVDARARVTGAAAMRSESYGRGLAAGREMALQQAADRLRKWMGAAFSQSTTNAAVRVVRGEDTSPLKTTIAEDLGN